MFNRLQIRILLILLGIIAVFTVGILIVDRWMKQNLQKAVRDFEKQQHGLLFSVIQLQANSTNSFSIDFSHWDEMVSFVENREKSWADGNLRNTISNYQTDHVWVFNPGFELLYYAGRNMTTDASRALPEKEKLMDIVRDKKFQHFFCKIPGGLVEVFGAPIQPMSDKRRVTEPKGWLFAGKEWSEEVIKTMAQMTYSSLSLDTADIVTDRTGIIDPHSALVHTNFVLEGWSGRPIGVVRSVAVFPFLQEYKQGNTYLIYISIFFIIVLLAVISILLFRFVEIPLRYLNKTLEMRDMRYLEPLKNYRSEFGRLTRSIQLVFKKEELLLETERRRRLESELHRSEQRFHLLVENLPDVLWIADAKGETLYYSSNLENVLGYKAEELVGRPDFWEKNIHPDDYLKVISRYSAFVDENYQFEVEYRLRHKNGSFLWISEKAISKFEHDGIQYCCGRISDITAAKLIDLKLSESEQQFRTLFEQNPFGVIIIDNGDQKILRANPAMTQMLGYQGNELLGKSIRDITPKEDIKEEQTPSTTDALQSKNVFGVEKRLYRKDGDLIWVNITSSNINDDEGKSLYGFSIVENITEKKQIQDKFAREHNLLVSLMENVPDLIFFKDKNGKYINTNQAALSFFEKLGIPDPIGMTDADIVSTYGKYSDTVSDDIDIMLSGIPVINKVEKIEFVSEEVIWLSSTKIPILSPDGKNDILVGILRNITERIENEIKLKQYAQELKDLNISKDKFVSILAHDLKNPFNAILGFSSVLMEEYNDYTDQERIHFIKNIKQSAENTFSLIENILEWSRSQTGRIDFNPDYCDLSKIIEECIRSLKPSLDVKGVKVTCNVNEGTPVFVDENMMKTVLRNLISNAFKFSKKNSNITINSRSLNYDMIEVSVEDEGIGIPEDALDRLFKIDDSYRREGTEGEQGTGLGLILCKEFIEKNGGLIWVNSQEGKGSKFLFSIPTKDSISTNVNE
jgi:PAS domain S-box-containing protein